MTWHMLDLSRFSVIISLLTLLPVCHTQHCRYNKEKYNESGDKVTDSSTLKAERGQYEPVRCTKTTRVIDYLFRYDMLEKMSCDEKSDEGTLRQDQSIHAAHINEVHNVPIEVLIRPFESTLNEDKVKSLIGRSGQFCTS